MDLELFTLRAPRRGQRREARGRRARGSNDVLFDQNVGLVVQIEVLAGQNVILAA